MSEPTKNGVLSPVIEPYRLVKQGRTLEGNIGYDDLQRLPNMVEQVHPPVKAGLEFSIDQQGRKRIIGQVDASVSLLCQRCLEPMAFSVEAKLDLFILRYEDQAVQLSKSAEWILVEDETMDLVALVEDEIILALPTIASHPEGQCVSPESDGKPVELVEENTKSNPFDVLGALKTKH